MDISRAAATIFKFQAALAEYDEETAMSFIDEYATLVWVNCDPENIPPPSNTDAMFVGAEAIRKAYELYWFNNPITMIKLDVASLQHEDLANDIFYPSFRNRFIYKFKGSFLVNGEKQERQSITVFRMTEDYKIHQFTRYSKF